MKNKIVVILSLVFILSINFSSGTIIIPGNQTGNMAVGGHPPIRIIGNDQFTPENGVTGGDGTPNDPYVIENWVIVSGDSASQGIFINDTDAYFVIRNCTISGFHAPSEHRQGIQLSMVTHGTIDNTTVSECEIGIWIRYSLENKIINCTCFNYPYQDGYGICIGYSTNISIISSQCHHMDEGIDIVESSHVSIRKTECSNNVNFGLLADVVHQSVLDFLIENCSFNDNVLYGIWLFSYTRDTTSSIIRNCSFHGNQWGISIDFESGNIIENCVFDQNERGINLMKSENNTIKNCSFRNNSDDALCIQGGVITPCRNNNISYCDFINNFVGIFLVDTRDNTIHHCIITNTSYIGVICASSSYDRITSNNIVDNGRNYTEKIDQAGIYCWRSFLDLRYNWWGSSQGPGVSFFIGNSRFCTVLPLRTIDNSDLVMLRYGLARFRPWSSAPVLDAGRET